MQAALRAILEKMEEITSALKKTSVAKCDEMGRMAMALARLGEAAEVLERSVMRQEGKREQASPKRSRLG
jgi:predicted amino acid dehydrogenase